MSKNSRKRFLIKRLQKATGFLQNQVNGSALSSAARLSLPDYIPSQAEADDLMNRYLLRPANRFLAIMLALYIQMMTKEPTSPVKFNHYSDIRTIQDWLIKQPLLFRATTKEAADALAWAMDFRLSIAHNWINRLMKHRQHHLSAVILLASDTMINDGVTKQFVTDLMRNRLGLSPLTTLPRVPPTPK